MTGGPTAGTRKLLLFVAGNESNSLAARRNFARLCDSTNGSDIECDIVDVIEHFRMALEHNVLVTPCLVLVEPEPRVMIVGTLKDLARVRAALRLEPEASAHG